MFWRVVENFTDTQRRQLLKFVTSCSRPPLLGFKVRYIRLQLVPSLLQYKFAWLHGCMAQW